MARSPTRRRTAPSLTARWRPRPPKSSRRPDIKLKDPKDWKIIGKGLKRLDTPIKAQGKTIYGIDIRLPGMLYAAIKACPVNGGKIKSFDAAKITAARA